MSAMLCPLFTYGQQAKEEKVKVGKTEMTGFVATSKYDKTLVDEALTQKLTEAGLTKHGKKKKFYTFMGASWPAVSATKMDIYYKVSKKKHKAKIYVVASKGYDNYITAASDATTATNITNFIGSIDALVERNAEIKRKELEMKMMNEQLAADKENLKKAEEEKARKAKELDALKQKS